MMKILNYNEFIIHDQLTGSTKISNNYILIDSKLLFYLKHQYVIYRKEK